MVLSCSKNLVCVCEGCDLKWILQGNEFCNMAKKATFITTGFWRVVFVSAREF
jgi:hypothetical protein